VPAWWADVERRLAVHEFCKKYSRLVANPSQEVARILDQVSAESSINAVD